MICILYYILSISSYILFSSLSLSLSLSYSFFLSYLSVMPDLPYHHVLACYDAACVPLPVPNEIYYIYNIIIIQHSKEDHKQGGGGIGGKGDWKATNDGSVP